MVTDAQVRRLKRLSKTEETQELAAAKAGMDVKTARKYLNSGKLPSENRPERTWRTRKDPFERVWEEIRELVDGNPGLEAKTIFEALQRKYPGEFGDGQLRTLQRRLKRWRATEGPGREVFFVQRHVPGRLGEAAMSDPTVTQGRPRPYGLHLAVTDHPGIVEDAAHTIQQSLSLRTAAAFAISQPEDSGRSTRRCRSPRPDNR
jgi:hypothetical protein